jgi:hypothetical protein
MLTSRIGSRNANLTRLGVELLEGRALPSTLIYSGTFDLGGVASGVETVTLDDPSYPGLYKYNFHLTNNSFASGVASFAVPVEQPGMAFNLGSSAGWMGMPSGFLGDPDLVSWQAGPQPALGIGNSADFWFTTIPTGLAYTNGIISDPTLASLPAGLLVTPIVAAPVPQAAKPLLVAESQDKNTPNMGLLSLREAIDYVNRKLAPIKDEIEFTEGLTGATITLGALKNLPPITTQVYINGGVRGITITRDPAAGDFRLFKVSAAVSEVVSISGLTLSGGGGAAFFDDGGAIESFGSLVLTDCTIQNNQALSGGGINVLGGRLDIVNCNIHHNTAQFGAGIHIADSVTMVNITGSTIHHNTATSRGGGIYILGGVNSQINLVDDSIYLNLAASAGGGVAMDTDSSAQLTLSGVTQIIANWAWDTGSRGGGIYLGAGTLRGVGNDVLITENYAASGGGLYLVNGSIYLGGAWIAGNLADETNGGPP